MTESVAMVCSGCALLVRKDDPAQDAVPVG